MAFTAPMLIDISMSTKSFFQFLNPLDTNGDSDEVLNRIHEEQYRLSFLML